MERRFERDRRKQPRGGRRPQDQPGQSPLVMVIEPDAGRRDVTEAILAKLRFAVVPVESVERAVALSEALRPAVIVCAEINVRECESLLPIPIPVVSLSQPADTLIECIRQAIRASKVVRFGAARGR